MSRCVQCRSIAIFVACLSLAFGLETVVFSPARRASRKLLERIVEFVRLAGGGGRIVEYNQEACRVESFDGKKSLIRSFPYAFGPLSTVCSFQHSQNAVCVFADQKSGCALGWSSFSLFSLASFL